MNAKATVRVTFEMTYEEGTWGDDCTIGQLRKQAEDGAKSVAQRVCDAAASTAKARLRIISIDKTTAVLLPEGKP